MSSVQPAPAMPGNMPRLPPNLTQQQVSEAFQVCLQAMLDFHAIFSPHHEI